jgi:hypothetical protein
MINAKCDNIGCDMIGWLLSDLSEANYLQVRAKMERFRQRGSRPNNTLSEFHQSIEEFKSETGTLVDLTSFLAHRPAKVKLVSSLYDDWRGLKAAELRGYGIWVNELSLDFADLDAALRRRGYSLVSSDLAQRQKDKFVRTRTASGYKPMPKKIQHIYEQRALVVLPNAALPNGNLRQDCPQEKVSPVKIDYRLMLNLRQGTVGNVRFRLSPVTLSDFACTTVAIPWEEMCPGDRFIYRGAVVVYLGREVVEVHDPLEGISHELADRLRETYICVLRAPDDWQLSAEQRAAIRAVRKLEREDDLHEFDEPSGSLARFDRLTRNYIRD